jgi:hypothetical protein
LKYEKEIKKIAKEFRVHVDCLVNDGQLGGLAYPWDSEIVVAYQNDTPKHMVFSILFHEIAHVLCYRKRHYLVYNSIWVNDKKTKIAIKHFKKTALKAELAADIIGAKLMKMRYPKFKFISWYSVESNQKKFLKRINKLARKWEKEL